MRLFSLRPEQFSASTKANRTRDMKDQIEPEIQMGANDGKFLDPKVTADGQERAFVALDRPKTLWFNT